MLDDHPSRPSRSLPPGSPALQLVGIGKRFRVAPARFGKRPHFVTALDDVNLEVPAGTCVALLGPNGAGKTTLVGTVAGLVRPTTGQIFVFGDPANTRSAHAAIGLVKQNNKLDPESTVCQLLVRHGRLFGMTPAEARRRTDQVIEQFGLVELRDKPPTELSGGELRRVVFAGGVLHRPRVLIVDEPTAGVDSEWRVALGAHIRRLNEAGVTVVLATHYHDDAAALCDRVVFIVAGQILAQGSVGDLCNSHGVDSLHALYPRIVKEDR
jgi:ABC-2 type transport system ATP-binding protein